jgi:hypothetical protein
MFEVIISSVITGRVVRRRFASRALADRFIDNFFDAGQFPRSRRNHRVEVHARSQPATAPARQPATLPSGHYVILIGVGLPAEAAREPVAPLTAA